jgi:DNA modification methylase
MITVLQGDCIEQLKTLPAGSVNCCVTSPPYWGLRDYGVAGQMGLETTPEGYVAKMVEVFAEVRRVLRDDGTLWVNLGDSYANAGGAQQPHRDSCGGIGKKGTRGTQPYHAAGGGFERPSALAGGLKPKDLVGIPWRVAFALQADGWYLRSDIIWHKPNPMPESVTDRPTKAHEYIFLLSKSAKYHFDAEAIREPAVYDGQHCPAGANSRANIDRTPTPIRKQDELGKRTYTGFNERWAERKVDGRNKRTVWTVATEAYPEAHFATYPPKLIEPCILAGCPEGGTVLDPFAGSGTTLEVAGRLGRHAIGIELNPDYIHLIDKRVAPWRDQTSLFEVPV